MAHASQNDGKRESHETNAHPQGDKHHQHMFLDTRQGTNSFDGDSNPSIRIVALMKLPRGSALGIYPAVKVK
jgi:hypothetical protein